MAQKLRLAHAKQGKRIQQKGPQLFAENMTHDQAQALCNQGHAAWFIWCDASEHPNPAERPAIAPDSAAKDEKPAKKAGFEKLEEPR